jgi:hypothetical protein
MDNYTHAIVGTGGSRVFSGPLSACEAYMARCNGADYFWRIVTLEEANKPQPLRAGAFEWWDNPCPRKGF